MKYYIPVLFLILSFGACAPNQHLFQSTDMSINRDSIQQIFLASKDPVLKTGDKITVSVWGHEDLSIGSVNSSYSSNEETGKWIVLNDEGKVNLPKIGRIVLEGLTIKEANYLLEQEYSSFLKNPIINIRVLNHYVTIIGEINDPGRFNLDSESSTLIELIADANGLAPYAKNDQVEIIRNINGKAHKLRVNLSDLAAFQDANILVQPDDVIYVAERKGKQKDKQLQKASLVTGILTGVALIFSVFVK